MVLPDEDRPEYGLEHAWIEAKDSAEDLEGFASRGRVLRIYENLLLYLAEQDCYCGEPPSVVKPRAGGCAPCQARERLEHREEE